MTIFSHLANAYENVHCISKYLPKNHICHVEATNALQREKELVTWLDTTWVEEQFLNVTDRSKEMEERFALPPS